MVSEQQVREITLSLPETEEVVYERLPGFRVKKKLFARIRQKPEALVAMRPSIADKEALIAAEPKKYFQTPHYEGHHAVLVTLETISLQELADILNVAWTCTAPRRLVERFNDDSAI